MLSELRDPLIRDHLTNHLVHPVEDPQISSHLVQPSIWNHSVHQEIAGNGIDWRGRVMGFRLKDGMDDKDPSFRTALGY